MRKSDVIEANGKTFVLYWKTALDGKMWCRIKVHDHTSELIESYTYRFYFKTKKAAREHILRYADVI